jgi:ketosteroid isomerase-like protein
MSEENVETVRRGFDAFNRADKDGIVAFVSPDVEWEDAVFARAYRGRAGVRAWFNEVVLEPWESFHVGIEEISEGEDDAVVADAVLTTRGKGSGVETQASGWSVLWITDGEITRRQVFLDRDQALEAAGLSE